MIRDLIYLILQIVCLLCIIKGIGLIYLIGWIKLGIMPKIKRDLIEESRFYIILLSLVLVLFTFEFIAWLVQDIVNKIGEWLINAATISDLSLNKRFTFESIAWILQEIGECLINVPTISYLSGKEPIINEP